MLLVGCSCSAVPSMNVMSDTCDCDSILTQGGGKVVSSLGGALDLIFGGRVGSNVGGPIRAAFSNSRPIAFVKQVESAVVICLGTLLVFSLEKKRRENSWWKP